MTSAALFHEGQSMPLGLNRTLISDSMGIIALVATIPIRKPALRPKLVGMVPELKLTTEMLFSFGSLAIRFANSSL